MFLRALGKEPFLHFLVLGALLFALDAWLVSRRTPVAAATRIEVTAGHLEQMREGYRRQFQRLPDEQELRGLIAAYLREEVLYREALALGMDRDDSIVRRRLAQKMEFITGDMVQAAAPEEAQLQRFFAERTAQYARSARTTFRHIYFSRQKRGPLAEAQAREALVALAHGGAAEELGDGFLLGFEFAEQSDDELAALFGRAFADQVSGLAQGEWAGPLISSYGAHLVLVLGRTAAQAVELAQVRERVERDYQEDRRLRANQALVDQLQRRYAIFIDEIAVQASARPAP